MGKPIGRRLRIFLAGAALAGCGLAIQPVSLQAQEQRPPQTQGMELPSPQDGGGWIGIGIGEVGADKTKELKLPEEYGAFVNDVNGDGPAAKAGIKKGDVVTEYNGERIEGARELRRLVRETPPGHTVKITVWRDDRAQTVSLEVGSMRAALGARRGPADGFGQVPPGSAPAWGSKK